MGWFCKGVFIDKNKEEYITIYIWAYNYFECMQTTKWSMVCWLL